MKYQSRNYGMVTIVAKIRVEEEEEEEQQQQEDSIGVGVGVVYPVVLWWFGFSFRRNIAYIV